jgi:hypothetical protein
VRTLAAIFIVKIAVTVLLWCIPLLLLPSVALESLGFEVPQPEIFLRLLGMAYAALVLSYWFGLRATWRGQYPAAAVWVGTVSNGGACALLIIAVVQGVGDSWCVGARLFLWISMMVTGLIALSLVVFGLGRRSACPD